MLFRSLGARYPSASTVILAHLKGSLFPVTEVTISFRIKLCKNLSLRDNNF
jgi:hypothetical protein